MGDGTTLRRSASELIVLVLSATAFTLGILWRRTDPTEGFVAYDFYGQFYPWVAHARRALATGHGFLWNPYQDCGQPFLANVPLGLLYPGNLVFAAFDREPALLANVIINLSIAAWGMYQLCRTLAVTRAGALCGALAFQLGWAATNLAAWSPTHIGSLAWLPVVVWRCERLVRAPTVRQGILMGLALTLQILPGFPQIVLFTYQVVALRIVWALLLRQTPTSLALVGATALGGALPAGLAAIQLIPSLEVARRSLWGSSLSVEQIGSSFSWSTLATGISSHFAIGGNALVLIMVMGALVAMGGRRLADSAFYVLLASVYFVLSLGPGSYFYALYEILPMGTAFRGSARLLWVTNFAVSVLVGLASDAFITGHLQRSTAWPTIAGPIIAAAIVVHSVAATGLGWVDWALVSLLTLVVIWMRRPAFSRWARVALPLLLVANFALVGQRPLFALRRGEVYGAAASAFAFVRARLTPQDRVLIVSTHPDLGLMPKSGTLLAIPNIHDYDPMVPRQYAEFFTFMRTGRAFRDMDDWYWLFGKLLLPELQRPLFDLTAARYLIVDKRLDRTSQAFREPLTLLFESNGVRVYENPTALPRARYVGSLRIEPEASTLQRLSASSIDLRQVALVREPPSSGFTGTAATREGRVDFVTDDPEGVVLRVHAPTAGFVVLADQHDPGWTAEVNDRPQDILRANHTFRAVEVPAGESEVVFSYRPRSLQIGAGISMAAMVLAIGLWRRAQ